MAAKVEDKKLLQRSQLCQHGEVWHVCVSEQQRPRPYSQCAFPKNGTATGSRRERLSNGVHGETKALISPPPR